MVDTTRSQANLRNFKPTTFTQQYIFLGYTYVVEVNVHVTMRCIVVTEHFHAFQNVHTLSVDGHQNLRLLFVGRCVRTGLDHSDHDFTARIASTRDVVLLAVDDPFVAIQYCLSADVLGI